MRVADDQVHSWQGGDLFRSALRIASGDDDSGFRVLAADSANRGARVLVGARSHRAGVEDYDGSLRGTGGTRKSALFELPFEGGAIGLIGAAAEVFDKESGHTLWYRTPESLNEAAEHQAVA
jgi:hypothetical protein